jgi:hypothetical protein
MSARFLALISVTVMMVGLTWGGRLAVSNPAGSEYASSHIIVAPRSAFTRARPSVQIADRDSA